MRNTLIAAATFLATAATFSVPAMAVEQGKPGGTLTRAEVQAKVQARFAAVDANRDGTVTRAEFDAHATKMKAERAAKRGERRSERFASLDTNKDGQVSREEFTAADAKRGADGKGHGKHRGGHGGHRMGKGGWGGHGMAGWGGRGGEDMFAAMDANKDGRVTLAEASARPLAMFDAADANKDGTVTPEERRAARATARAAWAAKRG
ncbi:EF-hand domain-containing protein [Sphingomonas solaris]|uniref:Calcium-binding protein n=1 Tax=Alterirhizorhabdus solaris TaxID=2529389 RepID=A0A558R9U7_9SPHN|nr:EF-hand domain-containing protein [Sphingomonas solaris]TVV76156.1 calcium-binding protein [Sphingomonas solaris]